jgi:arylsulfatase
VPKIFNLRTDPFEFADTTSNSYYEWYLYHGFMILAAQAIAGKFAATFKDFPPRQKAASFTIDDALAVMQAGPEGGSRPEIQSAPAATRETQTGEPRTDKAGAKPVNA